jgi:hypothetical protein
MITVMPAKQRGLSLSGFMFGVVILVVASIFSMKLIPHYMTDAKIRNIFIKIANDPEMKSATLPNIRAAFYKSADNVNDIKAVKAEDIQIDKDGGRLVLSASYQVLVPLAGNVSLYLDFNPSSADK